MAETRTEISETWTEISETWLADMETLLESVDDKHIQSYSISIVPGGLKESNKDPLKKIEESSVNDTYTPRVVSMGPRFKGSREDLLHMEEVKLRCLLSLIHRAGEKGKARKYLEECSKAIWEIEGKIRASYVADIRPIETLDLVQIMLMDGCFLLELLISKDKLNGELPCRLTTPPPAPQVFNNENVLSDLLLFENQIPICVLHALSQTLFPKVFVEKSGDEGMAIKINNLALSLFGYSVPDHGQTSEAPHILDVVHNFVNKKGESQSKNDGNHNEHNSNNHVVKILGTRIKLNRCASRLRAAGVTIKVAKETNSKLSCFSFLVNCFSKISTSQVDVPVPPKEESVIKGLDFEFKFNLQKGTLEIGQLHITETTKVTWRNIIAWEHHKKYGRSSPNGKFTSAALIFDGLICCAADVKLLKEKNVIVDHVEKRSDEELEAFFHAMPFGVDHGIVDSDYVTIIHRLNNYSNSCFIIRMWILFLHGLRWALQWLRKFMNENYRLILSFVTFLTFVQTFYAMLAYHRPT